MCFIKDLSFLVKSFGFNSGLCRMAKISWTVSGPGIISIEEKETAKDVLRNSTGEVSRTEYHVLQRELEQKGGLMAWRRRNVSWVVGSGKKHRSGLMARLVQVTCLEWDWRRMDGEGSWGWCESLLWGYRVGEVKDDEFGGSSGRGRRRVWIVMCGLSERCTERYAQCIIKGK